MQRLCSTLWLLASCICSWGCGVCFSVVQSPSTVTLTEADEVQIMCSFNVTHNFNNTPKVRWFKDNQKVDLNRTNKSEPHNSTHAVLIIRNAEVTDAGLYICEVTQDIPQLMMKNGTGTDVKYHTKIHNVTGTTRPTSTSPQATDNVSGSAVGAAASTAAVVLSVCVCLSVWMMKRRYTRSAQAVIREGPPSEGEEPGNSEDGGSSGTSRGSTIWYMVPVYESYFDLQRSDDEKCADSTDVTCADDQKHR